MVNQLKEGQWAMHYKYCKICGKTNQPHRMLGLCKTCDGKLYHQNNKKRINLQHITNRRLKKGYPCLKIIIDGVERHLPFESIAPIKYGRPGYEEYLKNMDNYKILLNFWNKGE